jgi:hypothetical protein
VFNCPRKKYYRMSHTLEVNHNTYIIENIKSFHTQGSLRMAIIFTLAVPYYPLTLITGMNI